MPQEAREREFLQTQQAYEHLKGRFLGSFGQDLFPDMHMLPVHAVPKPCSEKLCMVINQSVGQFAPNSMIKHEDINSFPLDNMRHLEAGLLAHHQADPNQSYIIYKLDISEAYCLLPMHPLWQIKQVVTIDGASIIIIALENVVQQISTSLLMVW